MNKSRLSSQEQQTLLDISAAQWVALTPGGPVCPRRATITLLNWLSPAGQFIVTLNLRDLQRMELRFPQLKVVSPEDFLKELQP
ncbi:MAG: hypothetical protein IPJ50_05875 [Betaproteobacteria bacterium]|nr:hypothetical protein [Betaproteobacteria bacterium]